MDLQRDPFGSLFLCLDLNIRQYDRSLMNHYSVGYLDSQEGEHRSFICEYAASSYDAIKQAQADVPYLQEHPHRINEILLER